MGWYRKRPVAIEAWLFDGSLESIKPALNRSSTITWHSDGLVNIRTLEGVMVVSPGDWIIRGVAGEFYPCKPDIFAATYDEVT